MSVHALSWVLRHSEERLGNRLVLIALADYAHEDGSRAFPAVSTLGRDARMSERGVRDCLRSLEANGAIVQTGVTQKGTRIYRIVMADSAGGQILPGGQNPVVRGADSAPDPSKSDPSLEAGLSAREQRDAVRKVWSDTPGLIAHGAAYFSASETKTAVAKALKTYSLPELEQAIALYGQVLESDGHFWQYRWPLREFLARGLDRFVPAADPLREFKIRELGGKGKSQPQLGEDVEDEFSVYADPDRHK